MVSFDFLNSKSWNFDENSSFPIDFPIAKTVHFPAKFGFFHQNLFFFENEAKNQKSLLAHFYIHATNEAHQF